MRLSYILAFSALVAVSSAKPSEECDSAFGAALDDWERCFPFREITVGLKWQGEDALAAESALTEYCTVPVCTQADEEAIGERLANGCKDSNSFFLRTYMGEIDRYSPLKEIACFLDLDKNFAIVKNPWIFTSVYDAPWSWGPPNASKLERMISKLNSEVVCTKFNQHALGTVFNYVDKSTVINYHVDGLHFPALWVAEERQNIRIKCGDKFADGLDSVTGPPYPEVQKMLTRDFLKTKHSPFSKDSPDMTKDSPLTSDSPDTSNDSPNLTEASNNAFRESITVFSVFSSVASLLFLSSF